MEDPGKGQRSWAPLDMEDVSLTAGVDFEAYRQNNVTLKRKLSRFAMLLLIGSLLSLTFTFFGLYLHERGRHGSETNFNGVRLNFNRGREELLLSKSGYNPLRDFKVDVDYRGVKRRQESKEGMVSSNGGYCSDMANGILKKGGNAFDAAVTAALCLGLMHPESSGIGGGGFILLRLANGTSKVIDAREEAPLSSSATMYRNRGRIEARIGGRAIAVPLEAKGLELMQKEHGILTWKEVVTPVIPLAAEGFEIHPYLLHSMTFKPVSSTLMMFDEMRDAFLIKDGPIWRLPNLGEKCCKRPVLAKTLELLAEQGAEELYNSSWGDDLADDIKNHVYPGIIDKDELVRIQPRVYEPVKAEVFGMEVLAVPPPSSAATMITALKLLDTYTDVKDDFALNSHRVVEAMKHMFAIRSNLGDPGENNEYFNSTVLLEDILKTEFAEELRKATNDSKTSNDRNAYGGPYGLNSEVLVDSGTTNFCIVDKEGNAVGMTTSINSPFGSYVISPKTGVLLNNLMSDFKMRGVLPRDRNALPASRNIIAPGKKPLSSMSPTMLVKDGKVKMVVGASGGTTIITSILQVLFNRFKRDMDLQDAILEPRLHDMLTGGTGYEDSKMGDYYFHTSEDVVKGLKARGHNVTKMSLYSHVAAIEVLEDGTRVGVADPRKDGAPSTP